MRDANKVYADAEGLYEVGFSVKDGILIPFVLIPREKVDDLAFVTCAENLNKILKLETADGKPYVASEANGQDIDIKIGKYKVGKISKYQKMGTYQVSTQTYDAEFFLTTFEIKQLSQGNVDTIEKLGIPFDRDENTTEVLTDLHSHFTGVLDSKTIVNLGIKHNILYPVYLLEKLGVDIDKLRESGAQPEKLYNSEAFRLTDVLNSGNYDQKLIDSLSININRQETFEDMDNIYDHRWPFFNFANDDNKTEAIFKDVLTEIANQYKASGVTYTELAITSLNTNSPHVFEWLDKYMPEIEETTGVSIRFLAGIPRSFTNERMGISTQNIFNISKSPYVVGCDFLGHEINSTKDFEKTLRNLAKFAMLEDPSFIIRVHSGESSVHVDNTELVFSIIEDVKRELEAEGHNVNFPKLRIGHSLHGVTEEMKEKCKKYNAAIEINYSSNLSLNNLDNFDNALIKDLMDYGIEVRLGSDGPGMYHTDARQEVILAKQAGLTEDDLQTIRKGEENYIAERKAVFQQNIQEYGETIGEFQSFGMSKTQAIQASLSSTMVENFDIEPLKALDRQNATQQERLAQLEEECQYKNINFITNNAQSKLNGKKPIYILGHDDNEMKQMTKQQLDDLKNKLLRIVLSGDKDNTYFVVFGMNEGISGLFMQCVAEAKKMNYETPLVQGLTTLSRAGENNVLPVDELKVNPNDLSFFSFASDASQRCQTNDGEMFVFGGDSYISDIIQKAHNNKCNIHLDASAGGSSSSKAQFLQGNKYEFNTLEEMVSKSNFLSQANVDMSQIQIATTKNKEGEVYEQRAN